MNKPPGKPIYTIKLFSNTEIKTALTPEYIAQRQHGDHSPSTFPKLPGGHGDAGPRYPSPDFVFWERLKSGRKRIYAGCGSEGTSVPS